MNLIALGESIGVHGFLHNDEAVKLVELAAGKDVCELGAFRGLSAWLFGFSAKSVVSIDHFSAATDGQRHTGRLTTLDDYSRSTARYNNVRPLIATSEEAIKTIVGSFGLIFIDADHHYEACRDDIQRWWPKLKPGGILAGHDYGHDAFPGVKQAFDEIFGPAPEGTTVVTLRWVTKPL